MTKIEKPDAALPHIQAQIDQQKYDAANMALQSIYASQASALASARQSGTEVDAEVEELLANLSVHRYREIQNGKTSLLYVLDHAATIITRLRSALSLARQSGELAGETRMRESAAALAGAYAKDHGAPAHKLAPGHVSSQKAAVYKAGKRIEDAIRDLPIGGKE